MNVKTLKLGMLNVTTKKIKMSIWYWLFSHFSRF